MDIADERAAQACSPFQGSRQGSPYHTRRDVRGSLVYGRGDPCGRPVPCSLVLYVRRFRCHKRTCERKIFAEPFPDASHF